MNPWRRLSFLLSTWHTQPLHIVPRQSTFYPTRLLSTTRLQQPTKPPKRRPPPVSPQELAVQQSISARRIDQAKRQLMGLQGNKLDRFHTWRPLLLLARKGRYRQDLGWLQEMVERQGMTRHWGLVPDLFDYHALMFCYGVHGDELGAERIMQLLSDKDLTPSVFTINTLLGCYQRTKAIDKALLVLEQYHSLLDVASYNTVLAMLDSDGQWTKATQLYHTMPFAPDRYTLTTMLHVATQTNNRNLGKPIYRRLDNMLTKRKPGLDITAVNAMLSFQVSVMNNLDLALAIYQDMCTTRHLIPDTITCNVLLDGLLHQRNPGKTAAMVHQMKARGHLVPDHVTYGMMMEAEILMGDLDGCLALFDQALALPSDPVAIERMMACLAKAAATLEHDHTTMERLWTALASTQHTRLDVKAYNGLMHGLAKLGRADLAQTLYDRVFRMHVCVADVATFTSLMLAYINNDQVDDAMEIYYVLREQHYKQQQQQQQQRPRRPVIALDTVFYTTLISALTNRHLGSALELFTDMRQLRIQPTLQTYTAMLHWCGQNRDLEGLDEVHRMIKMDMALDPDVGIYNALMDGYNRTDQIDQVLYLWDTMLTTSIGIDPTTVSIVLDACGHHHQPQRANSIWAMMLHRNDVQLNTNNYNSYVECLCRVGTGKTDEKARWYQALDVVRSMLDSKVPSPNAKTFNTLASFARKYGLNHDNNVLDQLDRLKLELQKRSLLD